jgi:hypothetical protein
MIECYACGVNFEITFEEENIIDYDGIYCEYIPWENIYFDGDSID